MKINITKKLYKHLLELLYLGDWTANSFREHDERIVEYDEVLQYFYSFAKDFGFDDVIPYDKSLDGYYPTKEYEDTLQQLIEDNDDNIFWSQLSLRLAKRDISKLNETFETNQEYLTRLFQIEENYEREFEKTGIAHLAINKD